MSNWKELKKLRIMDKVVQVTYQNKISGKFIVVSARGLGTQTKEWSVVTDPPIKLVGWYSKSGAFKKAKELMK